MGAKGIATRIQRRPDWGVMFLKGFPHLVHLRTLRRALFERALEREGVDSIEEFAAGVTCSRSTLSRLLSGRTVSLVVLLRVLDALGLRFEEVCWPLEGVLLTRVLEGAGAIERKGALVLTKDPLALPGTEHIRPVTPAPALLPRAVLPQLTSGTG